MSDDALAEAYNLGLKLEKSGDVDGAAAAYQRVLALDPTDHGGAAVRLAAMGRGPVPDAAPEAYVAALFDQNAAAFDDMLVEQLGYSVPMLVRERIDALRLGPFANLLDLGCGTGLTGTSLGDLAGEITGVDLSEEMLAEADERDRYDAFYVGEAVAFLEEGPGGPWDLITATDVLPYIGALGPFFDHAAAALAPGGVLVVSTETLAGDLLAGRDYIVGAKHRFAHAQSYVTGLISASGLDLLEERPITVRYDEGAPVPGYLVISQRSSAR